MTLAQIPESVNSWTISRDAVDWSQAFPDWDHCFANPMQSTGWSQAWWEHIARPAGDQLAVLQLHPGEGQTAYAPFVLGRTRMGRTLRLLGSGTTCSDYVNLGLSCERSGQDQAVDLMVDSLCQSSSHQFLGPVDCIELEGFSRSETGIARLIRGLKENGWQSEQVALEGTWVTHFPTTWEAYEQRLSKSRRRKVRKALKWQQEGTVQLKRVTTPEGLKEFWPDIVRLHQDRRGMLGQSGCFADPNFQSFLKQALDGLTRRSAAFVAGLDCEANGQGWIAVLIVLVSPMGWQVYQSGADTRAMRWEPGHTLNGLLLKQAFDEGIPSVDFLRGDEPYKKGWAAEREPLYRVRLFNRHWTARLRYQGLRLHRQWQQWTGKNCPDASMGED